MPNYLSYFIISFITSSLSTSYINTLYQKNIKSITDELNLQFEENRSYTEQWFTKYISTNCTRS